MKLRRLPILALAGICGMVPWWGQAAEPLRLEEAVARTLASHPSLTAETAQLRAVQARAEREGLPPPLVVGGEFENAAGTGTLSGINSAETTLRISRVIELGGKRAARQALGRAEVNQQRHQIEAVRIDLASRTANRFIEVLAQQQRVDYAGERVTQAERTRREVAGWVAAARNPDSDLHAAEIALAEAELALETAEHELTSARLTLAASWGALTPDFGKVAGDLEPLPTVEPFETLAGRLPQTPEQHAARLQAEAIAARRRVAEAIAKPDIDLSLGVRRLEAYGDQALVMSVAVPLGSRKRAGYSIAQADAELSAAEAGREADRIERHQRLFERYQELVHARHELEALQTNMLPKAETALATTRRGFEAGRFSFISLAQAQRTLFDLRERAVDAAARYHLRLVEVERLTATVEDTLP